MNSIVSAAITEQLGNGLTAIYHPMVATDVVTVDIWIEVGGRLEPPELLGVSHFLEHMVFKGTERLKPGELDLAIERRGGIANAATSQDYTHFYITVAADDLAESLPYLAEAVTQASIPDDEFKLERRVVLEEIRRSQDSPDYCAYYLLAKAAYPDHPYSRPVLGTEDSLMALTPEQMRSYHRSWYCPERMTVVLAGNFQLDSAQKLVETHFGHLSNYPCEVSLPVIKSCSGIEGVQRVEHAQPRLEQTRAILAWPGVSQKQWDVACGLDMLAAVLGDGRASRLVKSLREDKGLVRDIGASSVVQFDSGLFYVSTYLDADKLELVEAEILAEVERFHNELISEEELSRVRSILTNEFVFSAESPSQLARMYGFYHLCGGLNLADRYLEGIQNVTTVQLKKLAQTYLRLDRFCTAVLKPEDTASCGQIS